jgi:hypothetical protein
MTTERENPLLGLETPLPPEDLRGMTLAAAVAAMDREPRFDLWSRLWFSRPLRLAWTVIVLVAVAGHAWLFAARGPASSAAVPVVTVAPTVGDPELEEIVRLPQIDRDLLADAGLMAERNDTHNRKEGS